MNKEELKQAMVFDKETNTLTIDFDKTDKQLDAKVFCDVLTDDFRDRFNFLSCNIDMRSSSPLYLSGDASNLFRDCRGNITGCENLDVSGVTNMHCMFGSCGNKDFNPDVSQWDTSNVVDMSNMFAYCSGKSFNPDISNWDTSSVTNMTFMFGDCSGDGFNPDVSDWDTSCVCNMSAMFSHCSGNSDFNPDVSQWDTSNVTDMSGMFYGCHGLCFNPDVSDWDVSNVTDMSRMFGQCCGGSFNPDISNWDMSSVRTIDSMFYGCRGSSFVVPDFVNMSMPNLESADSVLLYAVDDRDDSCVLNTVLAKKRGGWPYYDQVALMANNGKLFSVYPKGFEDGNIVVEWGNTSDYKAGSMALSLSDFEDKAQQARKYSMIRSIDKSGSGLNSSSLDSVSFDDEYN